MLGALVDQPQSRVSTHLASLRHCGFVETERRGKEIIYRLKLRGLDEILGSASDTLQLIAKRLATCTAHRTPLDASRAIAGFVR